MGYFFQNPLQLLIIFKKSLDESIRKLNKICVDKGSKKC